MKVSSILCFIYLSFSLRLSFCSSEELKCRFQPGCDFNGCNKEFYENSDSSNDVIFPVTCEAKTDVSVEMLKLQAENIETKSTIKELEIDLENVQSRLLLLEDLMTWYKGSNNFLYKVFHERVNYATAQSNCRKLDAKLVSDALMNYNIRTLLVPLLEESKDKIWMGLDNIENEDTFIWSNGTIANPQIIPWHYNQPSSSEIKELRCTTFGPTHYWLLKRADCSENLKYVCEKQMVNINQRQM